ncbi:hypothetical protein [Azospirillum endophyticum]
MRKALEIKKLFMMDRIFYRYDVVGEIAIDFMIFLLQYHCCAMMPV